MENWSNTYGWSHNTMGFLNADGQSAMSQGKPFSFQNQFPQVGVHNSENGNSFGVGRDLHSIREQVSTFLSGKREDMMERRADIVSTNSDRTTFTPRANATVGMGGTGNLNRSPIKRKPFIKWFFGK